jgi:hypothetical protein
MKTALLIDLYESFLIIDLFRYFFRYFLLSTFDMETMTTGQHLFSLHLHTRWAEQSIYIIVSATSIATTKRILRKASRTISRH